ncbi:MAG: GYD domain-containing protein [Acidimicrobiia bacterium]
MAKYLVIASYSPDGIKGVLKTGGTARSKAVGDAVKGVGGTMESFHFAFGADDAYVVVDMPDNVAAAALAMAVSSTGLAGVRVVVLLTPSEIDEAAKRQVAYTPPGK